jgi:hypothetical protein
MVNMVFFLVTDRCSVNMLGITSFMRKIAFVLRGASIALMNSLPSKLRGYNTIAFTATLSAQLASELMNNVENNIFVVLFIWPIQERIIFVRF